MVLKDLVDTLGFLKKERAQVYIVLSEDFSNECRNELAEFALNAEQQKEAASISIFYNERKIAEISMVESKEKIAEISLPIKYMLYRLYDERGKVMSEENAHDVYGKAVQYINEHLIDDISTADVAKHVNYSESYFGYAFKKKYGVSIGQYIVELRLAKSKNLLRNTSFSIAGVASSVGFDSPNYFSSLFKKHFGVSPKEYRKMHGRIIK